METPSAQQQMLTTHDTRSFREVVQQYVVLNEQERTLRAQLKELRDQKQQISESIITQMTHMNVDACRLPGSQGRVMLRTVTKEPTLSMKEVNELITSSAPSSFVEHMERARTTKPIKTTTTLIHRV